MAKISFTKCLETKNQVSTILALNNVEVEVKTYLTAKEKSEFIEYVLNNTFDNDGFASPMRFDIFTTIGLVKYYTNINLTDKLLSEPDKLYDLIILNHIDVELKKAIPEQELNTILRLVDDSKNAITQMNLSILGAMKLISANYDTTKLNIEDLMATLNDPQALALVKDIATKMG